MRMSKSGIDELTESLKKVCAKHKLLKDIPEKEIQRIIDTLEGEQFSDDRKIAMKSLNALLDAIVDDLV